MSFKVLCGASKDRGVIRSHAEKNVASMVDDRPNPLCGVAVIDAWRKGMVAPHILTHGFATNTAKASLPLKPLFKLVKRNAVLLYIFTVLIVKRVVYFPLARPSYPILSILGVGAALAFVKLVAVGGAPLSAFCAFTITPKSLPRSPFSPRLLNVAVILFALLRGALSSVLLGEHWISIHALLKSLPKVSAALLRPLLARLNYYLQFIVGHLSLPPSASYRRRMASLISCEAFKPNFFSSHVSSLRSPSAGRNVIESYAIATIVLQISDSVKRCA